MASRRALLVVLFLTVLSCRAQQSEQVPTLTSKSELVIVPVVVTEHGESVRGLAAKDFTIHDNDNAAQIATFEEVEARPMDPVKLPKLPPRTTQNYLPGGDTHQDLVILVADLLNSSWSSSRRVHGYLREIATLLEQSKTPFAVCVLTGKGMVQIHSIGNSAGEFIKAVDAWEKGAQLKDIAFVAGWNQAFVPLNSAIVDTPASQIGKDYNNARNLDEMITSGLGFEQIANAFQGIPGRKKLVWISNGSVVSFVRDSLDKPGAFRNSMNDIARSTLQGAEWDDRTIKALADANIAVYPVDSNSVVNPTWEERFSPAKGNFSINGSPAITAERSSNTSQLLQFAARTGGKACSEKPDTCVGKALNDATNYYVLGFYLNHDAAKGWHKLSVKVDRPDVSVRTRSGFLVSDAPAPEVEEGALKTALASPLDYSTIPISLQWNPVNRPGNPTTVELVINSPGRGISVAPTDGKLNVDMLAYVRPVGKTEGIGYPTSLVKTLDAAQQRTLAKDGFRFRKPLELSPGTYELRLLLRDNVARKIGTVSTVITIEGQPVSTPSTKGAK